MATRFKPAPIFFDTQFGNGSSLRAWDAEYQERVAAHPVFLATRPLFVELKSPPQVSVRLMRSIFHRIPGTQNARSIKAREFKRLVSQVTPLDGCRPCLTNPLT